MRTRRRILHLETSTASCSPDSMSSQRHQYPAESSSRPDQRQQQYQPYPQPLTGPPRANSDSSSSLYSLSAYSTDIQGQPIQSPYAPTSSLQPPNMSSHYAAPRQGSRADINLDDYLRELQTADASPGAGDLSRRDLAGLGFIGDPGLQPGSGYSKSYPRFFFSPTSSEEHSAYLST